MLPDELAPSIEAAMSQGLTVIEKTFAGRLPAGETKTVTFSDWGMPFTVTAPAAPIPYAQVTG